MEARNLAEQMSYTAEKALKDNADKIPEDVKTAVEGKISALKEVKEKDDLEVIKKATEELSTEMQKIGEHMAKAGQDAAGQQEGAAQPEGEQKTGDNVKDAEFEEKKDDDSSGENK
ncbi:Hsp70 family protein [Patescibacteria group bacterium]